MKKLVKQVDIKNFFKLLEGKKVNIYALHLCGIDFSLSRVAMKNYENCIYFKTDNSSMNIVYKAIKSLEVDETEEIIKIKAKIENGTLVTIRHYKPHEE